MALKVTPDLLSINPRKVQKEAEVLLIAKGAVGIILQGNDLESREVLGAGDRNREAAGPLGSVTGCEELLGRVSSNVD
jgi:hypothetical protein